MPSKTGVTVKNSYPKDLCVENTSTSAGIDGTIRQIIDGVGVNSAISLSDDKFYVRPQNDNSTGTFGVRQVGGNYVLTADTTNSVVKLGSSQVNALTQYQSFNNSTVTTVAGYHMVLATGAVGQSTTTMAEWNLGNGADPATTLDVSAETVDTHNMPMAYWYLPDAITIVSASIIMGVSGAADMTLNYHLMSYAMDTTTNYGDLSDGVVIADSGETSAVDEDVLKFATMTNLPTDVAAGRIVMATVESSGTSPVSANMIVKYHIQ